MSRASSISGKNPAAVLLGAMGGAGGKGASKRRSVEHYRAAAKIRWDADRAEKLKKKSAAQAVG